MNEREQSLCRHLFLVSAFVLTVVQISVDVWLHGQYFLLSNPAIDGVVIARELSVEENMLRQRFMSRPLSVGTVKDNDHGGKITTIETRMAKDMANDDLTRHQEPLVQHNHVNNSDYAYAFVIGGCDPVTQAYRGFVYNILIAVRLLRQLGSVADVVAFFQLKHGTDAEELPDEDVRLLTSMKVHIIYIPKSPTESFYDTVMNKFRVLSLTQYRRVIVMDGDVVPVRNLDYLFALSDPHTDSDSQETKRVVLQENVIVAGAMEPANAGFFLLAPRKGDYEQLQDIIQKRAKIAAETPFSKKVHFDEVKGWGYVFENGCGLSRFLCNRRRRCHTFLHRQPSFVCCTVVCCTVLCRHEIMPPDRWTTRRFRYSGTNWNFHFAYSDQGLCT
jgi:hypothetical protein